MLNRSYDSVISHAYDRNRARRPLRIAMVAPPWFELPPVGYGGIEQSCAVLVDALVARRHEVTLFGAGERTGTAATFVSTVGLSPHDRMGDEVIWALHAARVDRLLAAGRFDVVHDHTISGALTARTRRIPTVVTAHNL
ncbi:MAG TPA: glycosyltransferase, partial [Actinoplanes sp.]